MDKIISYISICLYELGNPSVVWLSFDLRDSLFSEITQSISLSRHLLFDLLKEIEDSFPNLTFLIPSFTFDFPLTKTFCTSESKPKLGAVSMTLFRIKYPWRTLHPFYSFYIFGKEKQFFENLEHFNSVGSDSIFATLIDLQCCNISLGHCFVKSFSIVHHFEYILDKPYRFVKVFDGRCISSQLKKSLLVNSRYFGRRLHVCSRSGLTLTGLRGLRNNGCIFDLYDSNKPIASCINLNDASKLLLDTTNSTWISYMDSRNPNNVITNEMADILFHGGKV